MKLLFDQGTPAPLRGHLPGHSVDTLAEKGWSEKSNGELLDLAEQEGYEILVTTDQSLPNRIWPAGESASSFFCRRIGRVFAMSGVREELSATKGRKWRTK